MNQSNFQNFNYQQPPQPQQEPSMLEKVFGASLAAKIRSPLFATAALLVAGVAFGAIIFSSYPDSGEEAAVPIVQAEAGAFKETPEERGGLRIANQDSTIFTGLSSPEVDASEPAPIENLLASNEGVDRLDAFAAQAQEELKKSETEALNVIEDATGVDTSESVVVASVPPATRERETISPEDLIQKVESSDASEAGTAPETLEFVKNVLDQKDAKAEAVVASAAASAAANIQPAAGFAKLGAGTHYVQLGSVKTASGASSEWGKLQKKYPSELNAAKYRVERADLGEKGIFYRIQAGPMSSESAAKVCGSIKAKTPGGCLVTQ